MKRINIRGNLMLDLDRRIRNNMGSNLVNDLGNNTRINIRWNIENMLYWSLRGKSKKNQFKC